MIKLITYVYKRKIRSMEIRGKSQQMTPSSAEKNANTFSGFRRSHLYVSPLKPLIGVEHTNTTAIPAVRHCDIRLQCNI